MSHTLKFKAGIAILAIASLTLSGCSSSEDSSTSQKSSGGAGDGLTIGTLLPNTGTLAFLGPPTVAGVGLAVEDINAAGGVLGEDVTIVSADSGDSTDMNVSTQGATELIGAGANVVIGSASSSVTLNVVDLFTEV